MLLARSVAVLLGGHASDALEEAVKGGRFCKSEHIGRFLERPCGVCVDEAFGLCRHVLLYPFSWRDAVGGRADELAEVLGAKVKQAGIVLDLSRLPMLLRPARPQLNSKPATGIYIKNGKKYSNSK